MHLRTEKGEASFNLQYVLDLVKKPIFGTQETVTERVVNDYFRRIKGEGSPVDPVLGEGRRFR